MTVCATTADARRLLLQPSARQRTHASGLRPPKRCGVIIWILLSTVSSPALRTPLGSADCRHCCRRLDRPTRDVLPGAHRMGCLVGSEKGQAWAQGPPPQVPPTRKGRSCKRLNQESADTVKKRNNKDQLGTQRSSDAIKQACCKILISWSPRCRPA